MPPRGHTHVCANEDVLDVGIISASKNPVTLRNATTREAFEELKM